ncbi:unnamed protein product, partial [Chrysoparadoxa australica]
MIGGDIESGGVFDPLGFSEDEPSLFRRRAVELKHGRVAMLACVGCFARQSEGWKLVIVAVHSLTSMPALSQFNSVTTCTSHLLCCAHASSVTWKSTPAQDYDNRAPGELGNFGYFARPSTQDAWESLQLKEIKHGRLAQLGMEQSVPQE